MGFNANKKKLTKLRYDLLDNLINCEVVLKSPIKVILETEQSSSYWFEIKGEFLKDYPKKSILSNSEYIIQFSKKVFIKAWQECPEKDRDFDLTELDNVVVAFSKESIRRNKKRFSVFTITKLKRREEDR